MADAPLALPAPRHLHAAARAQGVEQMLRQVDAMDGQQIDPLHRKPLKAEAELGLKGGGILLGGHLGLEDAAGIGALAQQPAQLTFGAAVMAGSLNVVQPLGPGLIQGRGQIGLALCADLVAGKVCPALLKPHAPHGEHRHGQLGAAEATGGNGPRPMD